MIVLQIAATAILAGLVIMLAYGIAGKSDRAHMSLILSISVLAMIGLTVLAIAVLKVWRY